VSAQLSETAVNRTTADNHGMGVALNLTGRFKNNIGRAWSIQENIRAALDERRPQGNRIVHVFVCRIWVEGRAVNL